MVKALLSRRVPSTRDEMVLSQLFVAWSIRSKVIHAHVSTFEELRDLRKIIKFMFAFASDVVQAGEAGMML